MSDKKWKEFLQKEMDKELEEIDGILEEMNQDPAMRDLVAPEEMHDRLFAQIRENEAEKDRLSDDEKELIRLGMVYKKRRKWNKYIVLIAAVVCALAVGVTSIGGPERVMEKFGRMIGDREQDYMNTDDERTDEIEVVSEADAYEQIEEEFGFLPVKLYYLPEGMKFEELFLSEVTGDADLCYVGNKQQTIVYSIYPNYRTGSIGHDVEDKLINEYELDVENTAINVKEYLIEENQSSRYKASFVYQNIYYFLEINNINKQEVDKIIENLFFN